MRIAVIGSGVSGLAAAWALGKHHEVVLYEKDSRLGGHANTVTVDYDGTPIAVDTGFIVYNNVNYPNMVRLFEALGVETDTSDMSFGLSFDNGRLEWAGDNIGTVFAQKRNIVSLSHFSMIRDILRFNRIAAQDLASGALDGLSLGAYLDQRRFGRAFRDRYLLPMGAAIWSTPNARMTEFPARSFIEFFDNHALLAGFNTFLWRTVRGGSRQYVQKIAKDFSGQTRLNCGAALVTRDDSGVTVLDTTGAAARYDQIVFACHSDQALASLGDATAQEDHLLGSIKYEPNVAILHRDISFMPRRRRVWSSWNYVTDTPPGASNGPVALTYWMNRLQNIDRAKPLLVTLNPATPPKRELTFGTYNYAHPQFDQAAMRAQQKLSSIQGQKRTWFCGAWCGHGFHEDGLTSGLEIAESLGAPAPWGKLLRPRIFNPMPAAAE
jgi:predicted NAD/FAD-binding protein